MTEAPAPQTLADWLQCGDARAWLAQTRARCAAAAGADSGIWIHLCDDAAWAAQMQLLRSRLPQRAQFPLLGVPFAVKDNIDIAGAPTSAACPAFASIATTTAHAVQKLLDAGAVWLGKTNLDQFATGLVGTRSPYGRPASVADAARISGGSSSGSAVAVARGLVVFALGTDTAGSGRVPAGFNGIVGFKPTPGRVGTSGVLPACRTLDCVSIFAADVGTAASVLAVVEGADDADPYSAFVPGPGALPQQWRIGVPAAPRFSGDAGYAAAWQGTLQRARDAGHVLAEIDFAPLDAVAALLYDGPWVAERHAVVRDLLASDPDAFDPNVRAVIARADRHSATDLFSAQYALRRWQRDLASLWDGIDLLLVPTAPGHPRFAEVDADPIGVNAELGRYTNFVNLLGWCALALPSGRTAAGLPFGATFIAPANHDARLAEAGRRWLGEAPLAHQAPAAEPVLQIAVVGAHLSGLPLNGQLRDRGAVLLQATTTAPHYRLHALPGTTPPKPGLLRVPSGGSAIAVEVWALPQREAGSFLALVPPPLAIGSVELADGRHVHGFLCEPHALAGAEDISRHGGWRAYLGHDAHDG